MRLIVASRYIKYYLKRWKKTSPTVYFIRTLRISSTHEVGAPFTSLKISRPRAGAVSPNRSHSRSVNGTPFPSKNRQENRVFFPPSRVNLSSNATIRRYAMTIDQSRSWTRSSFKNSRFKNTKRNYRGALTILLFSLFVEEEFKICYARMRTRARAMFLRVIKGNCRKFFSLPVLAGVFARAQRQACDSDRNCRSGKG